MEYFQVAVLYGFAAQTVGAAAVSSLVAGAAYAVKRLNTIRETGLYADSSVERTHRRSKNSKLETD